MSNDDRPTSPPLPQSWFSTVVAVGDDPLPDEPPAAPPAAAPAPAGLGWKPPSRMRVRVPVFGRDAAADNTTPAASPGVHEISGSGSEIDSLARTHAEAVRTLSAPRVPTPNDETVRQLREHIVPGQDPDMDVVDARFDPDFQEVASGPTAADCAARFHSVVNFAPPDQIPPPKGAEAAQASADPCGRDDATPNDGVVPPRPDEGFRCALWSNDMLEMRTSDGEHILLNSDDTRALLRYVGDKLSARARAAA